MWKYGSKSVIVLSEKKMYVELLIATCHSSMGHSRLLKSLKAADFGLFGATWWPRASWERLRTVTYLATWVRVPIIFHGGWRG
jgi:hypothetical protein